MSNPRINNLTDLKRHSKSTGDHFFDGPTNRAHGTLAFRGIYREPYGEPFEGYVITVNKADDPEQWTFLYRFRAGEDSLKWFPIGRYESLVEAEAFLRSMGAVK